MVRRYLTVVFLSIGMGCGFSTAAPFGEGAASYGPPSLPEAPAVDSEIFLPATTDAAGIQAAIDDAHDSGGGTVQLAAGTYLLDAPITLKSNIRLQGQGMGQTILRRASDFTTTDKYFVGSTNAAISDVVVSALTLDRDFTRQDLVDNDDLVLCGIRIYSGTSTLNRRIRVSEVEAQGFTVGILMSGTRDIIVENCDLHDNGGSYLHHNLYFRRIGLVSISGCSIYDSVGGSGLKLAGGTTNFPEESRYFTIQNNDISDNQRLNLNIQGCHHMLIEGNLLARQISTESSMAGMFLRVYQGYECRYTDIINNVIIDNAENGFHVEGCRTFSIEGNACSGNGTNYNLVSNTEFSCDYNTSAPNLSLEMWRFTHFGSFFNEGVGSDQGNPDGDSRSNLMEYATGTNPNAPDAGGVLELGTTADGSRMMITFDRISDPALTYSVVTDVMGNLEGWTEIWSSTGASNVEGPVSVPDTGLVSDHDCRFMKLGVSY